jgi:hypothetical protein
VKGMKLGGGVNSSAKTATLAGGRFTMLEFEPYLLAR